MYLASTGSWAAFAGNLHPIFLHLPIGAVVVWVCVEIAAWFSKSIRPARRTLLWLTMLSSVLAFASGWLLGATGDYGGPVVTRHKTFAIVMTALLVLLSVIDLFWRNGWLPNFLRGLGAFVIAGCAIATGHVGGSLTHGPGFLDEGAPPVVANWVEKIDGYVLPPVPAGAERAPSSEVPVFGILERHCVECHGPNKQKGKLRLDDVAQLRKQVVPGDVVGSELLRRILLPRTHEDVMPPEDPMPDEDVLALVHWVRDGAAMDDVVAARTRAVAQESAVVARLEELAAALGARVQPVDGGQLLRVDFARADEPPAVGSLAALAPVAERVRELSFAGQTLAPTMLQGLPRLPALRRLNLERTGATNEVVARLIAAAPALRFVNLHSTKVDAGILAELAELEELNRLVLFGTSISTEQVDDFRAAHPKVEVTAMLTLPPARAPEDRMRRILAADASKRRIALLRETAIDVYTVLWEHEIEQIHDLHVLDDGNVLFQRSWTELVEVDPSDGREVWRYDAATQNREGAPGPVEVHSFGRLANGHTYLAESGPARIVEVDADGTLHHVIAMQVDNPDPHRDTRLVRPTVAGYLVAHEGDRAVREYDRDGNVVWSHDVGAKVFSALRLPTGHTVIGTGDGHQVIEVDPAGEVVWSLTPEDVPGMQLAWITTLQLLHSGNLLVGNCHADPLEPQLFEVTRDKQVVWTFRDHERFGGALSNSQVVEPAGP